MFSKNARLNSADIFIGEMPNLLDLALPFPNALLVFCQERINSLNFGMGYTVASSTAPLLFSYHIFYFCQVFFI